MTAMDPILFGDNQFFGVNHMSEGKARAQAMRFRDTAAVIGVLDEAYAEGIRTFMCTTHERMAEVCDHFRENREKYPGYKFYPCMPYAHKYANAAAERGVLEAVRSFLPEGNAVGALLRGGVSFARKDVEGLAELLVDAEMKMFAGLETPVIFLQNVATDFLLGLGFDEAFRMFADCVRSRYGAEPGFITMNAPRLLGALEKVGIDNPIICANINKIGFRMCGGQPAYEELIAQGRCRMVAMSVFASGALPPEEALQYVCRQPQIESIVFGASSRRNIAHTRRLIEELRAQ
ncbi:MAG TPA: hypothetical protein VMU40_00835 [Steroidobacteraceae bacterium]|nr:hypothetical protein [Steroidobacteraceae bacterium]